jgi:predicted acyltransferase
MNQRNTPASSQRLISLDVFRGITIAGMILVNNPGSWGQILSPLRHAEWNGCTPTDLVFPFFLFIVGVAMTFSFERRIEAGYSRATMIGQIVRRTIILFLLGLIMYGFPDFRLIGPYILTIVGLVLLYAAQPVLALGNAGGVRVRKVLGWILLIVAVAYFVLDFGHFQETKLRVPGVLQRIAACYLLASIIMIVWRPPGRVIWVLLLLAGYWVVALGVSAPSGYEAEVTGSPGLLHDWIDARLLGRHLYRERPDPEGILSTLPATATVLLGVLTGRWLRTSREKTDKALGLFFAANVALVLGLCMNYGFPINKKIWSSSYVVFTAGLALHFLAMCYWLIDVKGWKRWAWPFVVFGSNAIVVFVASSLVAKMMIRIKLALPDGGQISLRTWIYDHGFASWAGPLYGSLFFALAYVLLWLLPMIPLYRRRIFIKI